MRPTNTSKTVFVLTYLELPTKLLVLVRVTSDKLLGLLVVKAVSNAKVPVRKIFKAIDDSRMQVILR